jgi:hypothetical protein
MGKHFEHNLGRVTAKHQVTANYTRSDIAEPAIFLMSNPANHWIKNVASGGVHGFWLELLKRVIGDSAKLEINSGHNLKEYILLSITLHIAIDCMSLQLLAISTNTKPHGVAEEGLPFFSQTRHHFEMKSMVCFWQLTMLSWMVASSRIMIGALT